MEPVRTYGAPASSFDYHRGVNRRMNRRTEEFRRELNSARPDRARLGALECELASLADQLR